MRAIFNNLPEPGIYEVYEHPTGTAYIELDSVDIGLLAEYGELELGGQIIQPPRGKKYVANIWVILDTNQPDTATPDKLPKGQQWQL